MPEETKNKAEMKLVELWSTEENSDIKITELFRDLWLKLYLEMFYIIDFMIHLDISLSDGGKHFSENKDFIQERKAGKNEIHNIL